MVHLLASMLLCEMLGQRLLVIVSHSNLIAFASSMATAVNTSPNSNTELPPIALHHQSRFSEIQAHKPKIMQNSSYNNSAHHTAKKVSEQF